ncbi:MAG: hypothetical protein AAB431_01955 [Patescibacteria group bacterium]
MPGNFAWHPSEGGLVLNGFFNVRSVAQKGAVTMFTYIPHVDAPDGSVVPAEDGRLSAGTITPLGDGSFRIDLRKGFRFLVHKPNRQLHPNCRDVWRDMSWGQYLTANPIRVKQDSWLHRLQVRYDRLRNYLDMKYHDHVATPLYNWSRRREARRRLTA